MLRCSSGDSQGRRAILGGVFRIGDKYYGITAQHARSDNEDEGDSYENARTPRFDADSDDEIEDPVEITSKGE